MDSCWEIKSKPDKINGIKAFYFAIKKSIIDKVEQNKILFIKN